MYIRLLTSRDPRQFLEIVHPPRGLIATRSQEDQLAEQEKSLGSR